MQLGATQEFWDDRYRQRPQVWSGEPNGRLVAVAGDLTPGTALDVGCGEGADAVWLATRGWNVLGIDVSDVALSRARAHTGNLDPIIADRLTWQRVDLSSSPDLPSGLDLVSVQFLHIADPERSSIFVSLAALVGVGGSLLVVAHHPSDLETGIGRPPRAELFYTPDQIAGLLDDAWDIRISASSPRTEQGPSGQAVDVRDTVLHAVRLR